MAKMTEQELITRDSKRDIGAELLQAVRDMKAGKATPVHHVKRPKRGAGPHGAVTPTVRRHPRPP